MLPVAEAAFQTVKDGLAMPFNVFGTKQKKKLLKWYNELIAIVGGDPDAAIAGEVAAEPDVEWSVMDVDEDGFLSLMQVESGDTSESFHVKKKSAEHKQIKKGLETHEVTVVTNGDDIVVIRVDKE